MKGDLKRTLWARAARVVGRDPSPAREPAPAVTPRPTSPRP